MLKLTIETQDKSIANEISYAYNIALEMTNIGGFIDSLKTLLPSFKIGRGGSHVWISNQSNERQAIIIF